MNNTATTSTSLRTDEYPVESSPIVPLESFGKDHWSTFAYIETRIRNYNGLVDHNHMRCDADRHPIFAAAKRPQITSSGRKYPTLSKGDFNSETKTWDIVEIEDHDDYDCVADLLEAGLLDVEVETSELQTGLQLLQSATRARFSLTDKGREIARQLIDWKGAGGNFHDFSPEESVI